MQVQKKFIFLISFLLITNNATAKPLTLILDWLVNPDHAAIFVAQEQGFFAKEGVEVNIIAPSNPVTSIGPILAIHDIRDALRCTRAEVVAISPLIGNAAFSGPAAKLMQACGYEVSPGGVARCYHDFLDNIIIDASDEALASSIRYETIGVQLTSILMADDAAARNLAQFVIDENSSASG